MSNKIHPLLEEVLGLAIHRAVLTVNSQERIEVAWDKWKTAGKPVFEEEPWSVCEDNTTKLKQDLRKWYDLAEDRERTIWQRDEFISGMKRSIEKLEDEKHGAEQKIKELEAQLPEGMEHCTLRYEACPVGHGWLTATNWVKVECPWCRIKGLEAKLAREEYEAAHYEEQATSWLVTEGKNKIRNAALEEVAKMADEEAGMIETPLDVGAEIERFAARIRGLKK